MSTAVERLTGLVEAENRYDIPYSDVLPLQLEAATERLQSRSQSVRLLANRAQEAGLTEIRDPSDLIPLLFAHTSYKSYAETWLTEGRWDRMSKWVETVSSYPAAGVDLDGIRDIDDWIQRMQKVGHYLSCSSGTTGKPSIMSCSHDDMEISGRMNVATLSWATGVKAEGDRMSLALMPQTNVARNLHIRNAFVEAFAKDHPPFQFGNEPITIGQTTQMITLRRRIADGSARPAEIADFEALSATRQAAIDAGLKEAVDVLVENRGLKFILNGMWAMLHQIATAVRERGYSGKDFNPDNLLVVAGGLKGAVLPPDYKEFVLGTFNVDPRRLYHFYSMQEINSPLPLCSAKRYHIPPWVMLLPLDREGDKLEPLSEGQVEGRAAFFDITLDGRWGGVISGDHIHADFGRCACGRQGPTVGMEITRYSDMIGGDKISCSGTIDAYIRGAV
jgi:hypothetical protein